MRIVLFIISIVSSLSCHAGDDFYRLMVPGNYILVGKALDSEATFIGKVVIESTEREFKVTRVVAGKPVSGVGKIEAAANGDAKVLRVRFSDNSISYEQTCMVGSDLDNHARISCYLYRPGVQTMNPGLEVLFNDHTVE